MKISKHITENGKEIIKVPRNDSSKIKQFIHENCIDGITFENS